MAWGQAEHRGQAEKGEAGTAQRCEVLGLPFGLEACLPVASMKGRPYQH